MSIAILAALFWARPLWLRAVVVASTVPIAIFINGMRIWLTGMISVKFDPALAQGFFHFFEGFVLFGFAALLLGGWAWLLDALFVRGENL